MYIGSRQITLIDTPGFEDTSKSDSIILAELSVWLKQENLKLSWLIYIHPITEDRTNDKVGWNLKMMETLVGAGNLSKVVLVTSKWDVLKVCT